MTNRKKTIPNQQIIKAQINSNSNNNNNPKLSTDDDNCSVICYKDSHDDHVGVIRIRQQPICPACNIMRPTISAYYKHLTENVHRDIVKNLCDENKYQPSVYDQVIHLAFSNNLYYQSPKFHFLYKHANDDAENSIDTDKSTARKRRNFHVSLVFQDKIYSQIGPATAQIREQLLKDLLADRADEISRLPIQIYYTQKKLLSDFVRYNAEKDLVILCQNSIEQTNSMIVNDEFKIDDDRDCKLTIDSIVRDVYSKSDEYQREQRFYSAIARRSFRKKNTFFCDICEKLIHSSDKHFLNHCNEIEHVDKVRHYQIEFLPWRRSMQQSLISGQTMKQIVGNDEYERYKQIMSNYLAPNSLSNRGRFCCAFCQLMFADQWTLEKHLHSIEHQQNQTSHDHKQLILNFANSITLPVVFKYNGIEILDDVPEDIRVRYQCRTVTRMQYDDDVQSFIRNYPFDTFEGVTRLLSNRAARRQRANQTKILPKSQRIYPMKTSTIQRGKRTHPHSIPVNKRFRSELNTSMSNLNRGQGLISNYPQSISYNNNHWSNRSINDQSRQEFFQQTNYSLQSNNINNEFYQPRSTYSMLNQNNYHFNRQTNYNENHNERIFHYQQTNYDNTFSRSMQQSVPEYRQQSSLGNVHSRSINTHPSYSNNNHFSHIPPSQPPMNPMHYSNPNAYNNFAMNNNPNTTYFQSSNNSSLHSYGNYRTSSTLPTGNSHSSNSVMTPVRTFDEFGLSSIANNSLNSYNQSVTPSFNQISWDRANFRGANHNMNNRVRRESVGYDRNSYSTNKEAGATFSYNSSNHNHVSMRGRGAARNFSNRY